MTRIEEIIDAVQEICDDTTVPKNVKGVMSKIVAELNSSSDKSIKVNKALNMLDEISDDNNLQAYSRTQIWNIVSMLETVE